MQIMYRRKMKLNDAVAMSSLRLQISKLTYKSLAFSEDMPSNPI